ncbi:hypothetical protein BTJ40_19750 [Microbulbifer sp. A4B17]|uniref:hypothetical protein n=1 Tax=Microbulbifer sp. A4B17 TaxID=359370 RepID=UPI000D52D42B|nr:hypothetical protein [Microbulbifer sp. A4B17]AWF82872.1 hypothetical protein BTJ40_19750 [Microbulbifer sp. A4B17]
MKKLLLLAFAFSFTLFAQAEETVTGTLEEIIAEDFETGKSKRKFSLKDEQTGHYFFIDADEAKLKGMKSGDRVKIRGERGEKRTLRITESEKIELKDSE